MRLTWPVKLWENRTCRLVDLVNSALGRVKGETKESIVLFHSGVQGTHLPDRRTHSWQLTHPVHEPLAVRVLLEQALTIHRHRSVQSRSFVTEKCLTALFARSRRRTKWWKTVGIHTHCAKQWTLRHHRKNVRHFGTKHSAKMFWVRSVCTPLKTLKTAGRLEKCHGHTDTSGNLDRLIMIGDIKH